MTDQHKNKQVIANLLEVVWRQGELDKLPDFWTSDCINHADPSALPGLEALHNYHAGFSTILLALSDVSIAIERQVAEGQFVTSQIAMKALHKGELFVWQYGSPNAKLPGSNRRALGKRRVDWKSRKCLRFDGHTTRRPRVYDSIVLPYTHPSWHVHCRRPLFLPGTQRHERNHGRFTLWCRHNCRWGRKQITKRKRIGDCQISGWSRCQNRC